MEDEVACFLRHIIPVVVMVLVVVLVVATASTDFGLNVCLPQPVSSQTKSLTV